MPDAKLTTRTNYDSFARDHLPPPSLWPEMTFTLPELKYPERMNAAVELLDVMAAAGHRDRPCIWFGKDVWSYGDLLAKANQIARVLVEDLGVRPGNRVLLRAANNPMLVACWFAVLKAGAIAVATMPLLRAKELVYILDKAEIGFALSDVRLEADMKAAGERAKRQPALLLFNSDASDSLEARMARKATTFENCDTAVDDVALIAFTSGTTGPAKGTVHFHRDIMAICDCFPRSTLKPNREDRFCGSPPLAFTFGLGGLVTFPMRFGASTVLAERPSPEALPQIIADNRATVVFTAPTAYRVMAENAKKEHFASLKKGVSAGEHLPLATFELWHRFTGIKLIDGLGATEMLHIFIATAGDDIRPGATGKAIPGYEACILDDAGNTLPPGEIGKLAVRGPTGCRYLADEERQRKYVQNGWNLTGDAYKMDADGYFWYQARADDMIISAGYNISGPEVEGVLLEHPKVRECAVIGAPDADRGMVVKAFVVLRDAKHAAPETVKELQDYVKAEIAPYKYPRAVEFVDALPRTETGKIQRFRLREQEQAKAQP
ncbi:MAG: AMP-binding protein [Alphaproteobacteria bacterium]|nr:AMP-binding protein [Alphaproteobacteria bacterium]